MLCRHCCERPISRPRRLCWACYYEPRVKRRYRAKVNNFFRPGHGIDRRVKVSLPPFPTNALPGTAEKLAVLEQRAQRRQELFHPHDASEDYCPALDEAG